MVVRRYALAIRDFCSPPLGVHGLSHAQDSQHAKRDGHPVRGRHRDLFGGAGLAVVGSPNFKLDLTGRRVDLRDAAIFTQPLRPHPAGSRLRVLSVACAAAYNRVRRPMCRTEWQEGFPMVARISLALLGVAIFTSVAATSAQAQYGGNVFRGRSDNPNGPTVSPYLNLLQNNNQL